MSTQVVVLGAVNVDMAARTEHRPLGGETVIATGFRRGSGGKGANQAVAVARGGADVVLVAAVGDDEAGVEQLRELGRRGVRTDCVVTIPGATTGVAMITVTPDGENSIVVIPGANDRLNAGHIDEAFARFGEPGVVVLQTEIDASLIDRAARRASGSRVIINNGPWVGLAADTLRLADPLVVNQYEAGDACGGVSADVPTRALAGVVREVTRARSVVVTLGSGGVAISEDPGESWVATEPATEVIDTTGAGDTFVGTVAAHLARGESIAVSVRAAVSAARESVSWQGARAPLDDDQRARDELDQSLR